MMKLKWLGDERILPGIAHVVPGTEFDCESDAARSYIDQKLAVEVKQKPATPASKEVN